MTVLLQKKFSSVKINVAFGKNKNPFLIGPYIKGKFVFNNHKVTFHYHTNGMDSLNCVVKNGHKN